MTRTEKYDRLIIGLATGFLLPFVTGLIVYLFSHGERNVITYLERIINANILTHALSLMVFPNLFLFLVYNRLDMLKAARGVVGITMVWAVIVFAVKFLR
ncbi:MAG: hypothetical protein R6W81_03665 [Bacteroidales bacterium]